MIRLNERFGEKEQLQTRSTKRSQIFAAFLLESCPARMASESALSERIKWKDNSLDRPFQRDYGNCIIISLAARS